MRRVFGIVAAVLVAMVLTAGASAGVGATADRTGPAASVVGGEDGPGSGGGY